VALFHNFALAEDVLRTVLIAASLGVPHSWFQKSDGKDTEHFQVFFEKPSVAQLLHLCFCYFPKSTFFGLVGANLLPQNMDLWRDL
jgi:hypothetical protein